MNLSHRRRSLRVESLESRIVFASSLANVAINPSIDEGSAAQLTGTIVAPEAESPFPLYVNWGDGPAISYELAAGATSFDLAHVYADDNPTGTPADDYLVTASLTDGPSPQFSAGVSQGNVSVSGMHELSGLAASRNNQHVLWTHNDAGDSARIFAIDDQARLLGTYALPSGAVNNDYEDIALGPGPEPGVDYLFVGDIGSNSVSATSVTVYRAPEPAVYASQYANPVDRTLKGMQSLSLAYPDGPHDAEAMFVDPLTGDLYIATKQPGSAGIYRATRSDLDRNAAIALDHVTNVPFNVASGAAISPTGREIVLRNESTAQLWRRGEGQSVAAALSGAPIELPVIGFPIEPNGEAIAFDAAGSGYFTISEGIDQPLYYFQRTSGDGPTAAATLVGAGATWKYLDDGTDPGTAWRQPSYDDLAWSAGEGQFGYGDGDEQTVVGFGTHGNNKFVTTYFRKAFSVAGASQIAAISLQLLFDDGAAVYLNGTEIARANLAAAAGSSTLATATQSDLEDAWFRFAVDPSLLVEGTNVLAVEVHQVARSSSDLSFDLSLVVPGAPPQPLLVTQVKNVAPTVLAPTDAAATAGALFTAVGSFVDPGDDSWSAQVDFSDGEGFAPLSIGPDKSFELINTFPAPGDYLVTVKVSDDDLGTGLGTLTVHVAVSPPLVTNVADSGPGSLRQAILNANASPEPPPIEFAIPGSGPHVIQLASNLPDFSQAAQLNLDAGEAVQVGTANGFTFSQFTSLTKIGPGTLTIGGAQSHASAAQLIVAAGSLVMASDGGANLTLTDNAHLVFDATQHLAGLHVGAGATAVLAAGGGRVLVVPSLTIDPTGVLDLADNDLVVQATLATRNAVLATVTGYLASGAGGLAWTGTGISSSAAASDPSFLTALGVMLNDDGFGSAFYSAFDGQAVDQDTILVKYTYYGDADLSGAVDGTDYALIDNGFNASLKGWFNGDFNYANAVDGTDYALIDNAFNSQGGPLAIGGRPLAAGGDVPGGVPRDGAACQPRSTGGELSDVVIAEFEQDPLDFVAGPAGGKRRRQRL